MAGVVGYSGELVSIMMDPKVYLSQGSQIHGPRVLAGRTTVWGKRGATVHVGCENWKKQVFP